MAIAERLRQAIEQSDYGSIRQFQQALEEERPDVRGASYSMVYAYLNGENVPSVDFLEAAADLLCVRPAWLAFGDGEMTAGEQHVQALESLEEWPLLTGGSRLRELLEAEDPEAAEWVRRTLAPYFEDTVRRIVAACPDADFADPEDVRAVAEFVEYFLVVPPMSLRGWPQLTRSTIGDVGDFLLASLHAFRTLIPERGEGLSIALLRRFMTGWPEKFLEEWASEQ